MGELSEFLCVDLYVGKSLFVDVSGFESGHCGRMPLCVNNATTTTTVSFYLVVGNEHRLAYGTRRLDMIPQKKKKKKKMKKKKACPLCRGRDVLETDGTKPNVWGCCSGWFEVHEPRWWRRFGLGLLLSCEIVLGSR